MITPEIHNHYVIKHSSGMIRARFLRTAVYTSSRSTRLFPRRSTTHYVFQNLETGREITIKSRVKIRRLITYGDPAHLTENQVIELKRRW